MSHWGSLIASNILIFYITLIIKVKYPIYLNINNKNNVTNFKSPLNIDIISIIYGTLLGDGHAENVPMEKLLEYVFIKNLVMMIIYYTYIV